MMVQSGVLPQQSLLFGLIFFAAITGGVVALMQKKKTVYKDRELKGQVKLPLKPAAQFLEQQKVVQTLEGSYYVDWLEQQIKVHGSGNIGWLMKPEAHYVKSLLNYEFPTDMDTEHYVIFAVVDRDRKHVLAWQLVNFAEATDDIKNEIGTAINLTEGIGD